MWLCTAHVCFQGNSGHEVPQPLESKMRNFAGRLTRKIDPLSGSCRNCREGNCALEGIIAGFALPKMAHATSIEVFRPLWREQVFAALGAFSHRTNGSYRIGAIGMKHGTFLTRLRAVELRGIF